MYTQPSTNVAIGPARSDCVATTATVAGIADLPQISYWATATTLDDLSLYPRFMRTIPPDDAPAAALCAFWKYELGLESAGIIYVQDTWGKAFRDGTVSACGALGMTTYDFKFETASASSIADAVADLAATGVKVACIAAIGSQDLGMITSEALANGMLGDDGTSWSWASANAISPSDIAALDQELQDALVGMLMLKAVGALDDNELWRSFAQQRFPSLDVASFNVDLPAEWQVGCPLRPPMHPAI